MYLRGLIVVAALVATGLAVPAPASARVSSLSVSPSQPVRDKTFTVRGTSTPKFARTVRLQRYTGGRWVTTRTTRSTAAGRYSFTYRSSASSVTLRAYVPKAKRKGKRHTYSSQKSAKLVVRPAPPAPVRRNPAPPPAPTTPAPAPTTPATPPAVTAVTVEPAAGHTVKATVTSTPVVPGRTVQVQQLVGQEWVPVTSGVQPASGPVRLSFDAPDPGTHQYRAVVTGASLPASTSPESSLTIESPIARVDIKTDDGTPITSGETYVPGEIVIDPRGSDLAASTTRTRLRVRGNSTAWVKVKLSYKIKLDKKTSLLGLPASKDWALLANFYDRSLMRNELAFEASRRVGLPWTPRLRFAELWVDGSYRGLYQIGQNIEAETGRVEVPDGGYLLEGDSHAEDEPAFRTSRGFQIFFKEPDDLDAPTQAEVARTVQAAEDAIYAGDLSRIDVRSFVDWYIVNELLKNYDSAINNSDWMVLSPDGTLSMGPVWDFDQAMGNRSGFGADLPSGLFTGGLFGEVAPSQILLPEGHWYNQLLANPAFVAELKARWREVRTPLAGLPDHAAKLTREIRDSAPRNFAEGNGGQGLPIGPSFLDDQPTNVFHGSWSAEAAALQTWIAARYAWMDGHLSD